MYDKYTFLPERKRKIMRLLHNNGGTLEAYYIAAVIGISGLLDAHRIIRREIAELIEMGYPIGSDVNGFFLIKTEKQLQVVFNGLMKKQVALSKRIANLYDGFYNR